MKLVIGKLYNEGIYLGKELLIDGVAKLEDRPNIRIFLKDGVITHHYYEDGDIVEDNGDMLPGKIIYGNKEYILNIHSFQLASGHLVYSLQYRGYRLVKTRSGRNIETHHNFYENDGESINELIIRFNIWKNQTGFPEEIRYIY